MDSGSRLVRAGAVAALALCAWTAMHGVSTLPIAAALPKPSLPWDADALPSHASDARRLLLRPVDVRARTRDALARRAAPDGEAFRRAALGVERWARVRPEHLLRVGAAALERWKERGDADDRRVGEALLRTFVRRTPTGDSERGLAAATLRRTIGGDDGEAAVRALEEASRR